MKQLSPNFAWKGIDMDKRILELAVEALEGQKARLETEIEAIRMQLKGGLARPATTAPAAGKRRSRTAAERKAQSERMKAYWASRKSRAAKTKTTAKRAASRSRFGPKTAAARKAQSERMKAYWAKRRKEKQG